MADKAADTGAAPKVAADRVEDVYLDLDSKEIVRIAGDTTHRYRPNDTEFGLYVETKAYRTVSGRKSA